MKLPRHLDGALVGEDMAHLVANHAGEFVVVAKESDHFSRDINAPSAHAERVHYRGIDEDDAKRQLRRRELCEDAIGDLVQMASQFVVMDDAVVFLQPFGFDVAQIQFLLWAENVGTRRGTERRRSRAFFLRADRASNEDSRNREKCDGDGLHSRDNAYSTTGGIT